MGISSVQFSSVAQSCPTLCDPMNSSTPGLPFHHQLPEFTQTHVHRVSDAIQPSHPLLSPSSPAPNPSQHQTDAHPRRFWTIKLSMSSLQENWHHNLKSEIRLWFWAENFHFYVLSAFWHPLSSLPYRCLALPFHVQPPDFPESVFPISELRCSLA